MNAYSKFMDISMRDVSAASTTLPWMKLPHRQYMVSVSRAALTPVERLAFLELAMYAQTQAGHCLIDNDAALAGWAGLSVKQWLKIKAAVFMEWEFEAGYWSLPFWFSVPDKESPVSTQTLAQEPVISTSAGKSGAKTNAERQKEYRARNKCSNDSVTENVTRNADRNENNVTHNATVTPTVTKNVTSNVTNEGGKGGDLDLNQDLDLDFASKKNKTNPPEAAGQQSPEPDYFQTPELGWTPRLKLINNRLQMAGHKTVTHEFLIQTLVTFNPHYDDKPVMSDNNRLGRLVDWIGDKQQKAARQLQFKQSSAKPEPNASYYGISKDDIQKYARTGETEFDCAKRLANERKQSAIPPDNNKKPLPPAWSMGNKNALKLIQQFDSTVTQESIDAMANSQGKERDDVLAVLYSSLVTKQRDKAIADAKVGAA